ncbi:MAG: hypothetical protein AAB019_03890 [Planctomycetota bacterium]
MKIISMLMKTVNWIASVSLGVFALMWLLDRVDLGWVGQVAAQVNDSGVSSRIIGVILAAYLVMFNFLYAFGRIFTRRYISHIKLGIESGNFSIAISAIENSLKRALKKLPDINDAHVRIYKERSKVDKPVRVYTTYSAWDGTNIKEVTDKIQSVVRMRFQEIVETKEPPVFEIVLYNIVEKDRKKVDAKRSEKELAEKKMFYGPEYPID